MTVNIRNVGPISQLTLPIPEAGGVVVLKARNGRGKSEALKGIEALSSGGKLSVRDGELQGQVEGFGAAITVSKSTRRTGELEVDTLDGRLSVADLVDPGLKSADAADAKRIKALVALTGADADASLFHGLVGADEADVVGLFEEIVRPETIATADLVQMAARVKADFEGAARREEKQAEHARGHAKALRETSGNVDTSAEHDADLLQAVLEEAIEALATLRNQQDTAAKVRATAQKARAKLAELGDPPSIDECKANVMAAEQVAVKAADEVVRATAALAEATATSREAKSELDAARKALAGAEHSTALTAELHDAIHAAESIEDVSAEVLAAAEAEVSDAREANEAGVRIRDALANVERAESYDATASAHESLADKWRNAAAGTDDVLSQVVAGACSKLRVEAGRLVLDTSRGVTLFAELSEGERWKIALDIAIDAVGERGLIVVPQGAWESLDPLNRELIAEHVRGTGAVVVTAEATADEELHAEVMV